MILCGGKGTRLRDVTELLPKPMVPIGEQPILWHIMKSYAAFGCKRFILCLGYKREAFVDYFMNYHLRTSDATITLGHSPKIKFYEKVPEGDWEVMLAGTGLETGTGGRVFRRRGTSSRATVNSSSPTVTAWRTSISPRS